MKIDGRDAYSITEHHLSLSTRASSDDSFYAIFDSMVEEMILRQRFRFDEVVDRLIDLISRQAAISLAQLASVKLRLNDQAKTESDRWIEHGCDTDDWYHDYSANEYDCWHRDIDVDAAFLSRETLNKSHVMLTSYTIDASVC
jgi:hypothetical protein